MFHINLWKYPAELWWCLHFLFFFGNTLRLLVSRIVIIRIPILMVWILLGSWLSFVFPHGSISQWNLPFYSSCCPFDVRQTFLKKWCTYIEVGIQNVPGLLVWRKELMYMWKDKTNSWRGNTIEFFHHWKNCEHSSPGKAPFFFGDSRECE